MCTSVNLTPPDYIEQLFYINTDDPLVYSLPTQESNGMPNQPIIRGPIRTVPNGTMRPMLVSCSDRFDQSNELLYTGILATKFPASQHATLQHILYTATPTQTTTVQHTTTMQNLQQQ